MGRFVFACMVGAGAVVLAGQGCSDNELPCCAMPFDAGGATGTVCLCGSATIMGASCYVSATSGACTIVCAEGDSSTTTSGTPLADCTGD
jgi:hypothetical protein